MCFKIIYIVNKCKIIIKKAGKIALDYREYGLQVERKKDNSFVTNADKQISIFIYQNLSKLTPKIPIICEERAPILLNNKKSFWLIDPIDGTRSYINNKDSFTINMAIITNFQLRIYYLYCASFK